MAPPMYILFQFMTNFRFQQKKKVNLIFTEERSYLDLMKSLSGLTFITDTLDLDQLGMTHGISNGLRD